MSRSYTEIFTCDKCKISVQKGPHIKSESIARWVAFSIQNYHGMTFTVDFCEKCATNSSHFNISVANYDFKGKSNDS